MQPYFAVPIEGIEDKSCKYLRDEAKNTNRSVTLNVSFINFFEDWWDWLIFQYFAYTPLFSTVWNTVISKLVNNYYAFNISEHSKIVQDGHVFCFCCLKSKKSFSGQIFYEIA